MLITLDASRPPPSTMAVLQALASYHTPSSPASISPSPVSVPSPIFSPASTTLQHLLCSVTIQWGFCEANVNQWVLNVLSKLLAINISTIDALYFGLPPFNTDLESQGIISLHDMMLQMLYSLLEPLAFHDLPLPVSTPSAHVVMCQEGEKWKRHNTKKRQHWHCQHKQPYVIQNMQTVTVSYLEHQCCMARVNLGFASATNIKTLCLNIQEHAALCCSVRYEDTFGIIWDNGASICITPDKTYFVGTIKSAGVLTYLQGVSKGLWIQGKGNIIWTILDI
jgi:hypothetical protein